MLRAKLSISSSLSSGGSCVVVFPWVQRAKTCRERTDRNLVGSGISYRTERDFLFSFQTSYVCCSVHIGRDTNENKLREERESRRQAGEMSPVNTESQETRSYQRMVGKNTRIFKRGEVSLFETRYILQGKKTYSSYSD